MHPVNMPDLIQKCSGYGQLWPTRSHMPDQIFHIQFGYALPGSYISNNSNMNHGWPGQVLAKQIWSRSKPACKNYWAQLNFVSKDGKLTLGH